jgi:FkbM family methyltransferase
VTRIGQTLSRLLAPLRGSAAFGPQARALSASSAVSRDHVRWAFRLLLDREFDDPNGVDFWVEANPSAAELRRSILLSEEFQAKNARFAPPAPRRLVVRGEIEGGLYLYVDLADTAIGRGILEHRYEPEERSWLLEQTKPGDVVVDLGANIGFFTVLLARRVGPHGRVLAYEPLGSNADLIARSVEENHLAEVVTLRRVAVGDRACDLDLAAVPEDRASNSGGAFLLAPGAQAPPGHRTTRVPVVALDQEEMPGRVALLKIDVEGAEPQVLRGARRLLERDRPRVLAEVNPNALRRAGVGPSDAIAFMQDLGYDAHRLGKDGLGPIEDAAREERAFSVVFLPRT